MLATLLLASVLAFSSGQETAAAPQAAAPTAQHLSAHPAFANAEHLAFDRLADGRTFVFTLSRGGDGHVIGFDAAQQVTSVRKVEGAPAWSASPGERDPKTSARWSHAIALGDGRVLVMLDSGVDLGMAVVDLATARLTSLGQSAAVPGGGYAFGAAESDVLCDGQALPDGGLVLTLRSRSSMAYAFGFDAALEPVWSWGRFDAPLEPSFGDRLLDQRPRPPFRSADLAVLADGRSVIADLWHPTLHVLDRKGQLETTLDLGASKEWGQGAELVRTVALDGSDVLLIWRRQTDESPRPADAEIVDVDTGKRRRGFGTDDTGIAKRGASKSKGDATPASGGKPASAKSLGQLQAWWTLERRADGELWVLDAEGRARVDPGGALLELALDGRASILRDKVTLLDAGDDHVYFDVERVRAWDILEGHELVGIASVGEQRFAHFTIGLDGATEFMPIPGLERLRGRSLGEFKDGSRLEWRALGANRWWLANARLRDRNGRSDDSMWGTNVHALFDANQGRTLSASTLDGTWVRDGLGLSNGDVVVHLRTSAEAEKVVRFGVSEGGLKRKYGVSLPGSDVRDVFLFERDGKVFVIDGATGRVSTLMADGKLEAHVQLKHGDGEPHAVGDNCRLTWLHRVGGDRLFLWWFDDEPWFRRLGSALSWQAFVELDELARTGAEEFAPKRIDDAWSDFLRDNGLIRQRIAPDGAAWVQVSGWSWGSPGGATWQRVELHGASMDDGGGKEAEERRVEFLNERQVSWPSPAPFPTRGRVLSPRVGELCVVSFESASGALDVWDSEGARHAFAPQASGTWGPDVTRDAMAFVPVYSVACDGSIWLGSGSDDVSGNFAVGWSAQGEPLGRAAEPGRLAFASDGSRWTWLMGEDDTTLRHLAPDGTELAVVEGLPRIDHVTISEHGMAQVWTGPALVERELRQPMLHTFAPDGTPGPSFEMPAFVPTRVPPTENLVLGTRLGAEVVLDLTNPAAPRYASIEHLLPDPHRSAALFPGGIACLDPQIGALVEVAFEDLVWHPLSD